MNSSDTVKIQDSKYFTITKDTVTCKETTILIIETSEATLVAIDEDRKTLTTYANVSLTVMNSQGQVLEVTTMKSNSFLTFSYTSVTESSSGFRVVFARGTHLFSSGLYIRSLNTANVMFKYVLGGKFNDIPYEELVPTLIGINANNNIKGHQSLAYEILVTELTRSAKDTSVPFRWVSTPNTTSEDYHTIGIRDVSRGDSAIASLMNENPVVSISAMLRNKKKGVPSKLTPLEIIALSKYAKNIKKKK